MISGSASACAVAAPLAVSGILLSGIFNRYADARTAIFPGLPQTIRLAPKGRLRSRRHALPPRRPPRAHSLRGMPSLPTLQGYRLPCQSCHKDTRHEGPLGASCSLCHNPDGWAFWRFDHAKQTKFPLTGAHQGLDCHACHKTKAAAKIQPATTCHGCHSADDVHSGAFGQPCDQCHTTVSFKQKAIGRWT